MALRNILDGEDPALAKTSRTVTDFNKRLHVLLDDMRETLLEANGLGLAAPQVGVLRRAVLIIDTDIESDGFEGQIVELINPEFIARSGSEEASEGCLSLPGVYGIVKRPVMVKIKAQDRFGNEFEMLAKNLTARAICHEIDHLNGVIFTSLAERFLSEEEIKQIGEERKAAVAAGSHLNDPAEEPAVYENSTAPETAGEKTAYNETNVADKADKS